MSKRKPKPKPILSRNELLVVRLCLFLAFAVSAYLAFNSLKGGGIPGCGPESDCDKVLGSRWAYAFGLPISLLAAPIYALAFGVLLGKASNWKILAACSIAILGGALWFVGLQIFVLQSLCKFCMTAHAAGVVAAFMLLSKNPLPAKVSLGWSAAGAAAVAVLIAAQILSPGQRTTVTYASTNSTPAVATTTATNTAPIISTASVTNATPQPAEPPPTLSIVGGQYTLSLLEVPVHGSPHAPKKVVKLIDYTCHHCRDMHRHFNAIFPKYSNQLAVISLPMPLDANCNMVVKRTPSAHINACEYARLSLAVFYAAPEKHHEFENWIFGSERPPALETTRDHARTLIGADRFDQVVADPRINERIKEDVEIYVANTRFSKKGGRMPQLIFTNGTSVGALSSPAELERILKEALLL